jgi:hypothetical protein
MRVTQNLFIGANALASTILYSCEPATENVPLRNSPTKKFNVSWYNEYQNQYIEEFTVIEVDSCEYLFEGYGKSRVFTHKGNCKYCAMRNNKNK